MITLCTIDGKANEIMNALIVIFAQMLKKSFLLKVSSVDSQKMMTKYPLPSRSTADAKKRIPNIILYLLALLLLR